MVVWGVIYNNIDGVKFILKYLLRRFVYVKDRIERWCKKVNEYENMRDGMRNRKRKGAENMRDGMKDRKRFFIDDLQLLAKDGTTLERWLRRLEINKEKSATNDPCCDDTANELTLVSFEEVQIKLIAQCTSREAASFSKLYDGVRCGPSKEYDHLRPYGLHSVKFNRKHMLLPFLDCLEKSKDTSTRRAAILKLGNDNKTHLSLIKNA
ncbi:hypothetical protein CWI38_0240p0040 [Hamiltosporidium tvaerminnensis]|uniref:Uncharacterized protein n=1 Tax=Hamiltosporidium tvaerminnensis TaxID=1176355 RepID=A0A4Q9LZ61_9MICR|nr:hypothetical protein CWI38_0240p0040 [Hamiltosporidium tvaerminnensis]